MRNARTCSILLMMASAPYVAILVVLFFAGVSFFFSLAETALFSLSKWQVRQLGERRGAAGRLVAQLLASPQELLATMALGNTFAGAAMMATALWMALEGRWSMAATLCVLPALLLLGCEVFPKTMAVRNAEQWALRVARAMRLVQTLAKPLCDVAQRADAAILKAVVPKTVQPQTALTDADYKELLEMAFQQGTLAESEKEIILQIISLDRHTANDVMRPRAQMDAISDDLSMEEMIAAAKKYKRRRLPIYDENLDTIVGILNTRALLLDPNVDLADAIEFPSFVPETMNLLQLLNSLQRQQRGIAIVLDEFGGTAGMVTVEDILSKLVGRLRGRAGSEGFTMAKLQPGRWRVSGALRLDDFRREYPGLSEVAEVETMGGLLMHLLGVVPAPGESATFCGLKLTAQVTDERRVRELLVEVVK